MNRRTYFTQLGGLGVAGLVGTAGCLADAPGAARTPTNDEPNGSATDTPTNDSSAATDGSPTATDGGETPPHDAPFPPGRDDVDEVVWFREVSDPAGRLHLAHSASSVSVPDEVSFTLHNNADATFNSNFYNWAWYRWEAGRWHRVAPLGVNDPLMQLGPGESHTWTVSLTNEDLERPVFRSSGTDDVAIGAVGGGSYAFTAEGWWADQDATPSYEHKTVLAARVSVDADQLPLVPSSAVTDTARDGDTVVVEADNPRTDGTPGTYVLTRDDGASDPRALVTEQVYRTWPLRDALAHADEDVSEVRVETTTGITPLFGVQDDEESAVTYDGRTYVISAEEREG